MTRKWPHELRKGDRLIDDNGNVFPIVKVQPVFGGSWFDVFVTGQQGVNGHDEPITFGHSEKVEVE